MGKGSLHERYQLPENRLESKILKKLEKLEILGNFEIIFLKCVKNNEEIL